MRMPPLISYPLIGVFANPSDPAFLPGKVAPSEGLSQVGAHVVADYADVLYPREHL